MTKHFSVVKRHVARTIVYQTPLGAIIRRIHKAVGGGKKPLHASAEYWDKHLTGRFAPYLGGTVAVDTRNAITRVLLDHVAPHTRSVLDVGCAGGTLLETLDSSTVERYLGLDISNVAVETAMKKFGATDAWKHARFQASGLVEYELEAGVTYDLIVFNEVLYYIDIDDVANQVNRYARSLTTGGQLMISLKNEPKSYAIMDRILEHYNWVHGVIYQQQATEPRFKVVLNQEMPAYLVGIFAPKQRAKQV